MELSLHNGKKANVVPIHMKKTTTVKELSPSFFTPHFELKQNGISGKILGILTEFLSGEK